MPRYELSLIISAALKRAELKTTIQRTCDALLHKGGVIRSMENLGLKQLPYKMSSHGTSHREGNYFLINFNSPPDSIPYFKDELARDTDVIRPAILRADDEFIRPCLKEPCRFGELKIPDYERRMWRKKTLKRVIRTKKDKEKYS